MKKICLFILAVCFFFQNIAQAQNVGINTSSPEYTLDARGVLIDSGALLNLGTQDVGHFLRFFGGQPNNPNPFISWHLGDPLRFLVGDDNGTFIERMRIRSGGTIGINNSSPQHALHVNEPAGVSLPGGSPVILGEYKGTNLADVVGVRGYSKPAEFYGIGGSFEGGWRGVEGKVFASGADSYVGVHGQASGGTGTNYGLFGSATGTGTNWAGYFAQGNVYVTNRVGIGQIAPLWPIDMSATQAVMRMTSTTATNGSVIELKNLNASPAFIGAINFNDLAGSTPGQIAYKGNGDMTLRTAGSTRLTINQNSITGIPEASFLNGINGWNLANGNATNIAVFGAAGNATNNWAGYFSIGNVYIADELRIGTLIGATGYRVSVDGKVMCEELKVQLNGNWPDYVFANDYDLLPLAELEKSVRENRHLPGIPSANDVRDQGIEVGEMQRLLLQKVEELTLYMIELKKENTRMQEEIELLKN